MLRKILLILTGALFIFSGLAKLFPIQSFELIIVSEGFSSWEYVRYIAVFIISIELLVGTGLLLEMNLKKVFLPAAFSLLIIFTIQLVYSMIANGSTDNCGCFGDALPMSPIEAVIKNVILLGIITYVFKKTEKEKEHVEFYKPAVLFFAFLGSLLFILPSNTVHISDGGSTETVIDSTVVDESSREDGNNSTLRYANTDTVKDDKNEVTVEEENNTETLRYQKDSLETTSFEPPDTLDQKTVQTNEDHLEMPPQVISEFSQFTSFSSGDVNLDEGKKIVCLFSLDCDHCMETAKEIVKLREQMKLPPVYALFFGPEDMVDEFFYRAGGRLSYRLIPPEVFFPLLENAPPRVVFLVNGNKAGDWGYENFEVQKLRDSVERYR